MMLDSSGLLGILLSCFHAQLACSRSPQGKFVVKMITEDSTDLLSNQSLLHSRSRSPQGNHSTQWHMVSCRYQLGMWFKLWPGSMIFYQDRWACRP